MMAKTALKISDKDMARYRASARQRKAEAEQERLQRMQRARMVAQRAADLLKKQFGAEQVILFGSLARGRFFHQDSDLDLAVKGIKNRDFWRAWSALDAVANEFEIDLVDIETASSRLRLELEREGIEL